MVDARVAASSASRSESLHAAARPTGTGSASSWSVAEADALGAGRVLDIGAGSGLLGDWLTAHRPGPRLLVRGAVARAA